MNAPEFHLVASNHLIHGTKLGRLKLSGYILDEDYPRGGQDYFRKVLKYKMLSYQYTTLGRMLKPPKFAGSLPAGSVDVIEVVEDGHQSAVLPATKAPLSMSGEVEPSDVTLLIVRDS